MPPLLPSDTKQVFDGNRRRFDARSLLMDKFSDPGAKDTGDQTPRRDWFRLIMETDPVRVRTDGWLSQIGNALTLYGRLKSRLMVDMAGGVMENAGLRLDRFGMPFVPGSAVKGCARRAAVHALLEADAPDQKAEILFRIALVFGWADSDWKPGRRPARRNEEREPHSDFWWAMADDPGDHSADEERNATWNNVAAVVAGRLLDRLQIRKRKHPGRPWEDLPAFGGLVSFLPACPTNALAGRRSPGSPPPGQLELDVVTCHHSHYYKGEWKVATDTDDPVPVVFPAVAPGHLFCFPLAPLRNAADDLLEQARTWLATGLEVFGIGAKTNAGYGWFVIIEDDGTDHRVGRETTREEIEPDPDFLRQLRNMKEPELRHQVNQFATDEQFWTQRDEHVQLAVLHYLLVEEPGILSESRANPKSKIAKAIANLRKKFPGVTGVDS